jgi:hypothetical protein
MYVKIAEKTNEYDKRFNGISHFEKYPQMSPFIGKNYSSEKGLLLIAQNPIIDEKEEKHNYEFLLKNNTYKILGDYYIENINDIREKNKTIGYIIEKWTDLERCILKYSRADFRKIPFSQYLYPNIVKTSKHINFFKDNSENIFSYIAFMDFFQKPNYIKEFIPNEDDIKIANIILEEVIKIIMPKYVYFASDCVFKSCNEEIQNKNIIIGNGSHPGYWNLKQKANHYSKPKDIDDISGNESFIHFINITKYFKKKYYESAKLHITGLLALRRQ